VIIRINKKSLSWNKIYSSPNHWVRTKIKNEWVDYIYWILKKQRIQQKPFKSKINIDIVSYSKRPLDSDNVCQKIIIDALKHYGLLIDDSIKYVGRVSTESIKSKEDYIIIDIKEI